MQLKNVTDPFGEVDVFPQPDGRLFVKVTILIKPSIEGAYTGLAVDGSNSMMKNFAAHLPPLFRQEKDNVIQPIARMMSNHLASFSANGSTCVIYWACGPGGKKVEIVGDITAEAAMEYKFSGPQKFGTGTKLLPPVRYFVEEKFAEAKWSMCVIITDGIIEDLDEVRDYSMKLAENIAHGKRNEIKMVIIGVGDEVDESQMEELDNLDLAEGIDVDIWDHKLAANMRSLDEVFSEVVSENTIVAASARITDSFGNDVVVTDSRMVPLEGGFGDGLPGKFYFVLPPGSQSFTLKIPDVDAIVQTIDVEE